MGLVSSLLSTSIGRNLVSTVVLCAASWAVYHTWARYAPPHQGRTHTALCAWPPSTLAEPQDDASKDTTTAKNPSTTKPVSVNYHFTRKCNAECGFCFHTEKTSHVASEADMKRGLALLKAAGMRKVNFAGGEPFLYPSKLAMLVKYCKVDLGLESVSIISNGTKVTRKWLEKNGQYVDVMGISCDSFSQDTNTKIGRDVSGAAADNVEQLFLVRGWCRDMGIKFKLNTVVCSFNWDEDMAAQVQRLDPFRWKCFQVLVVQGENDDQNVLAATAASGQGKGAKSVEEDEKLKRLHKRKRNAQRFIVSDDEFQSFCRRHERLPCFVPETNELMATSYLILDEYLCFLDKGDGEEKQSSSILEVGVEKALQEVRWDEQAFKVRGGFYEWSKDAEGGVSCQTEKAKLLEW